MSIKNTQDWFEAAVPNPSKESLGVQMGCHFEEGAEMLESMSMGFSPLATVAIIGTAGALGDAGSPASDSTLGPTAGLNVDGQHDHMRDTVLPTFIHYNLPLMVFGWIAAMVL